MFVPFISKPSVERRKLWRRKGGGGGGRGGGGGGGRSGGSGGGGSAAGRSTGSVSSGGSSFRTSTGGRGSATTSTIPAGAPFAGRTVGGGTRDNVYGSKSYGSGYPGTVGRGTAGRGFPFVFWPIAFVGVGGIGGSHYYQNSEYGRANNGSRPGGAQVTAVFTSKDQPTTFRILADNSTTVSLVQSVVTNCGSSLQTTSITTTPYEGADQGPPQPEQIIQYYRASSVALSLDGYNNSAVFSEDENAEDTPIPTNIDSNLLSCMNSTIGKEVPLVESGALSSFGSGMHSQVGLMGIAGAVWLLTNLV